MSEERCWLVVLCNAVQRMKQKASFASAIVVAMFGNKFAYGQTELVLRQWQSILCCLGFPVQFISETWSKWVRRGKQLRHKNGRLDTRSSENTQSKRDVLKFYSMSAPLLQKCVTLLQSKLEMQGTPQLSLLESPFVRLLSWKKHRSLGMLGRFPALSNGPCLWELSEVKS